MTRLEQDASELLRSLGVHPKYKGYAYLLQILRLT